MAPRRREIENYFKSLAIFGIRFYRLFLSPLLGGECRFTPSCSTFALEAFRQLSPARATFLTVKRLFSCHPFHRGGFDPVDQHLEPVH